MLEMKLNNTSARGFTLIELMVTISIAAILLMTAIPSVTSFVRNAELTSFSNTLLSSINAARGEAMKRGMYAMVVPTDGANWDSGWKVFIDMDRSQNYSAADLTISAQVGKPSYFTITGNGTSAGTAPYIMYDASGYSRTTTGGFGASTFEIQRNDVTGAELLSRTRRLKIASTGRARICTPTSTTDITCKLIASD